MNINVQQRRLIMSLSAMQAIGQRSPKWQPLPRIMKPGLKTRSFSTPRTKPRI